MKFIWNWFSGKTYTDTGNTIIDEDGSTFMKIPGGYVAEDGTLIQKVGQHFVNTATGDWSVNTDVFDRNNGY